MMTMLRPLAALVVVSCSLLSGSAAVRYVDGNNAAPEWPYTDWATAATSIQDAVDAAEAGDTVMVTNGVYQTGGRVVGTGALANRVAIDRAMSVQSVNGPEVTIIQGSQVPGTTNGDGAVRCAYVTNNAVLSGFTLTGGGTRNSGSTTDQYGGGVYCRTTGVVSNCVITGNAAYSRGGGSYSGQLLGCRLFGNCATNGGGAYSATLLNCLVASNSAAFGGGGAHGGSLSNCTLSFNSGAEGGGTYSSAVTNCTLTGNWASGLGGGSRSGTLAGCLLSSNTAPEGGGAYGSLLSGCTVSGNTASGSGGGVAYASLLNSLLKGNSALEGGGALNSHMTNCVLTGNSAVRYGGGARAWSEGYSRLVHCTVVGNTAAVFGGGLYSCTATNSILYFNSAGLDADSHYSRVYHSCTGTEPWVGDGNLFADPQLASGFRLSAGSPCRGAGKSGLGVATDMDGEPRANPPAMGCDEYSLSAASGPLSPAIAAEYTTVAPKCAIQFRADITGRVAASRWEFGDGTVISNRPSVWHSWAAPGAFPLVLRAYNDSYPAGVSSTTLVQVVSQPIHYVSLQSTHPVAPYTSWATAATNLQDGVDAVAVPGALVLADSGIFAQGGRMAVGLVTNRLTVTRPMELRSVSGPAATIIQGDQMPGSGCGSNAVRCAFLGPGVVLNGFTLSNGATRDVGDYEVDGSGGGFFADSRALLTNCVVSNNRAWSHGAGGRGGALIDCRISGNAISNYSSYGGGCSYSSVTNCALANNYASDGGGAYSGTIVSSTLSSNTAVYGGGAHSATLFSCTLRGNASGEGGGVAAGRVFDSSFFGNTASEGGASHSSTLSNCVVTGNSATSGGGLYSGAAHWSLIASNSATDGGGAVLAALLNCNIRDNVAAEDGGGMNGGGATNCALTANTAAFGGGAYSAILRNCAVTGNSANYGAGLYYGIGYNSILRFNHARNGSADWYGNPTLNSCFTTPLPPSGTNNSELDPLLASESHLSYLSPCRGGGNPAYAQGLDLDGEPWASPPSIGCDEYRPGSVAGPLSVAIRVPYTNVAAGFELSFTAQIAGRVSSSRWEFGDGTVVSNCPAPTHTWAAPGNYAVVLRAYNETSPAGISATALVQVVAQPVHYVSPSGSAPAFPYLSWASAATNIQDAVEAATVPGALVLVGNGVYAGGGRAAGAGINSNRVHVIRPMSIRSVNGPALTIIQGQSYVRCACLFNGASLSGFTLTNAALSSLSGGGVWCESTNVLVSNCIIVSNTASGGGGGAGGTFNDCVFYGNQASTGAGCYEGTLNRCTLTNNRASSAGGGAAWSTLNQCQLSGNYASYYGGGAYESTLNNCVMTENWAYYWGSAAHHSTLVNCTAVSNLYSAGVSECTNRNSIVFDNTPSNYFSGAFEYSCTAPLPAGPGNFTNPPLLTADLRPTSASPCINSGNNAAAAPGPDLVGNSRIRGGTVDVGAYEFQTPASRISYAWLQAYGLAADGAADVADADADGMNNWQEWMAGTDPKDASSALRLLAPVITPPGVLLSWSSATNKTYSIQRSASLKPPLFQTLQANLPGQADTTTFRDTNAPLAGAAFYRVSSPNASSPIVLQPPSFVPAALTLRWSSVTNRTYAVERSTNLAAFSLVQSNLAGLAGTTSFTDTNVPTPGFYRVRVSP